ncbi:MAG TPA: hypothetical protein VGD67_13730 [Pseudonocardiaceae bacterium]
MNVDRVVRRLAVRRSALGVGAQVWGGLLLVAGVAVLAGLGWALLAGGAGLLVAGTLAEAGS